LRAIFFAYPDVTKDVWLHIFNHRIGCIEETGSYPATAISEFRDKLQSYKSGAINFNDIKNIMLKTFTSDALNHVLAET
jgi:hypothetical protein